MFGSAIKTYKLSVADGIELCLAGVIVWAIYGDIVFLSHSGYLPAPFFHAVDDTFMDWYNPAYWSHNQGIYDEWGSVYPPLSFVLLRIFSIPSCYDLAGTGNRACDHIGVVFVTTILLINVPLSYFAFRRAGVSAALPRAVAIGLGAPMLFAWERGNLIVLCYSFLVLGYGRLLRSAWLKMVCAAVTVNFKPYLIILVFGRIFRRDWRWVEGFGVCCALVYAATYLVLGDGNPMQLARNIIGYAVPPETPAFYSVEFTTTYNAMLQLVGSAFPFMQFIGSRPIELMETVFPLLIRLGAAGVAICYATALWQPKALSSNRLTSLTMALFFTTGNPGGYAVVFLLFFVFFEEWRGWARMVVLVAAYIWCVPWDHGIVLIAHAIDNSYLSGRTVGHDLSLTIGQLVRPGVMLLLEYGLVAASFGDFLRLRAGRGSSASDPLPENGRALGANATL